MFGLKYVHITLSQDEPCYVFLSWMKSNMCNVCASSPHRFQSTRTHMALEFRMHVKSPYTLVLSVALIHATDTETRDSAIRKDGINQIFIVKQTIRKYKIVNLLRWPWCAHHHHHYGVEVFLIVRNILTIAQNENGTPTNRRGRVKCRCIVFTHNARRVWAEFACE